MLINIATHQWFSQVSFINFAKFFRRSMARPKKKKKRPSRKGRRGGTITQQVMGTVRDRKGDAVSRIHTSVFIDEILLPVLGLEANPEIVGESSDYLVGSYHLGSQDRQLGEHLYVAFMFAYGVRPSNENFEIKGYGMGLQIGGRILFHHVMKDLGKLTGFLQEKTPNIFGHHIQAKI